MDSSTGSPSKDASTASKKRVQKICNASLSGRPAGTTWDIHLERSITNDNDISSDEATTIKSISQHDDINPNNNPNNNPAGNFSLTTQSPLSIDAKSALVTPSLCNPHLHLDKPYLLSHPRYSHLPKPSKGTFAEAMEHTTSAKAMFTHEDLLERGRRVLQEGVRAGVTHVRAFVEVDAGVEMKCLEAGIALQKEFAGKTADSIGSGSDVRRCEVQLVAFAQLPLFTTSGDSDPSSPSHDEEGHKIRSLLEQAASSSHPEVSVLGSTPYVESSFSLSKKNITYMIDLSARTHKHLDFHLDYHLTASPEPLAGYVISELKRLRWHERTKGEKTVVLGHCTRLTRFTAEDWDNLRQEIGDLPVYFVGLPNSDLFMMREPAVLGPSPGSASDSQPVAAGTGFRARGSLDVVDLISRHDINACMGTNNIGNAFTPQGSCDPLALATQGVEVYSAGTERDAEVLFQCVSSRAREAIGMGKKKSSRRQEGEAGIDGSVDRSDDRRGGIQLEEGDKADLLIFEAEESDWRTRKTVAEAVWLYDGGRGRRVVKGGRLVSEDAQRK